jgi:hypothetical protein
MRSVAGDRGAGDEQLIAQARPAVLDKGLDAVGQDVEVVIGGWSADL